MKNMLVALGVCVLVMGMGCRDSQPAKPEAKTEAAKPAAAEAASKAEAPAAKAPAGADKKAKSSPLLKAGKGVDVERKILYIGALNDESGPAAAIGKPYALGKRLLVDQINSGPTGLLPDGWRIELLEKDHKYNPQKAVQAYKEIKDKILFVACSTTRHCSCSKQRLVPVQKQGIVLVGHTNSTLIRH